jgi:hypothetical protein
MEKVDRQSGHFRNSRSVEYIFATCDHFSLPLEAKYIAVELFDKFMTTHVSSLYHHVHRSSNPDTAKNWEAVEERLKSQLALRILSCIQLGSKLCSHYKALTPSRIKNFLSSEGHQYSNNAILQSEIRVLTTLLFNVQVTSPLVYMETLLETLGYNVADIDVKELHSVGVKVLDVSYLLRSEVYSELVSRSQAVPSNRQPSSHPVGPISEKQQADFMWLAAAVIGAASFFVDQTTSDQVVDQLSQITGIASDDIVEFSAVLVGIIIA